MAEYASHQTLRINLEFLNQFDVKIPSDGARRFAQSL